MLYKEESAELPNDMTIVNLILEKALTNGMHAKIFLVKRPNQFEAALFLGSHYKPGPPIPRLLSKPNESAIYWMGVRPSIGLSQFEGDTIIEEVQFQNKVQHCNFVDKWGHENN